MSASPRPVSPALREGLLTREELRALMRRSNSPALLRLLAWIPLLLATGSVVWLSLGSWWLVPAMFLHGIVIVHHFALQHECTHYTAFASRRMNDVVGAVCGFSIGLAPRFFRYEHYEHHAYTQLPGKDPEMIPLPASLWGYVWYIGSWPYWAAKVKELARHAAGRISEDDAVFVPSGQYAAIFSEARWLLAGYAAIGAVMVAFDWWAPLWFWILPLLLGEPVMRAIRLTEHVGRPTVANMRDNTRSNRVNALWRFLGWNMNYHAEHHYAASVPFHALPALHARLAAHLPVEEGGYPGAHADIIAQLTGRKPREDRQS